MATTDKKNFYKKVNIEGSVEFDFLDSELPFMDLKITRQFKIKGYNQFRADLISYEIYETPDVWWLILLANDIVDPFEELYMGRVLDIPSLSDYYKFRNKYAKKTK